MSARTLSFRLFLLASVLALAGCGAEPEAEAPARPALVVQPAADGDDLFPE